MAGAMKPFSLPALALRLRLACGRLGALACTAVVLSVAGAAALLWLLPERAMQERRQAVALGLAALPSAVPRDASARGSAAANAAALMDANNANLALFYDVLGEKRYAEQQVRTLFGLAAKTGLTLSQGEYKGAYDGNGKLHTYQVTLPVKGSYRAIWQFGLLALRAIPFASLDEISFRRDTIGEPTVEARLRLTMYLAGPAPGVPR